VQRLDELLKQISAQSSPPVELWKPEHCADMDLVIRHDGQWVHEGSVIERAPLVKLFASILKYEAGEYYLVTPVEKVRIKVENTPFIVCRAEHINDRWFMTNNLGEVKELTNEVQLNVSDDQNPVIFWRSNLTARINQSVMYQWQTYALDHDGLQDSKLWLHSGEDSILLATTEE